MLLSWKERPRLAHPHHRGLRLLLLEQADARATSLKWRPRPTSIRPEGAALKPQLASAKRNFDFSVHRQLLISSWRSRERGCAWNVVANVWDCSAVDIIGSALAYLGSVIGIVVGLPVLAYMVFATPHSPTAPRDATAVTQSEPKRHETALARLRKMGGHREVGRADRANSAGRMRYAIEGVPARRWQKSRGLVPRDRENEGAYHDKLAGFSRSTNDYARDSSGDFRGTW
jgi:hypothetical protein